MLDWYHIARHRSWVGQCFQHPCCIEALRKKGRVPFGWSNILDVSTGMIACTTRFVFPNLTCTHTLSMVQSHREGCADLSTMERKLPLSNLS